MEESREICVEIRGNIEEILMNKDMEFNTSKLKIMKISEKKTGGRAQTGRVIKKKLNIEEKDLGVNITLNISPEANINFITSVHK